MKKGRKDKKELELNSLIRQKIKVQGRGNCQHTTWGTGNRTLAFDEAHSKKKAAHHYSLNKYSILNIHPYLATFQKNQYPPLLGSCSSVKHQGCH